MIGKIRSTTTMATDDMFESGLARSIGANSYFLWMAIKKHADYQTGQCWPGYRHLTEITGLTAKSIKKFLDRLIEARLIRIAGKRGQQNVYVARERLDITLGDRVVCTVVMDYVPEALRGNLKRLGESLKTGEHDPEIMSQVEIIPGPGFIYDQTSGTFRAEVPASQLPRRERDLQAEKRGQEILDEVRRGLLKK